MTHGPVLESGPRAEAGRGEVFTKAWVVEFILDLADYRSDRDLTALRLVEPACGTGAFLTSVARRISQSCRKHDKELAAAITSVRAYDLSHAHVRTARSRVREVLLEEGWPPDDADAVAHAWVTCGDYLLGADDGKPSAELIVGNPPYVRLEDVPEEITRTYRSSHPTMTGRADLYVGFYERALRSLADDGTLAFICADRWMRNQYGRELRHLVSTSYSVEAVVTMHDIDAFEERVSAYPAVTVIRRATQGPTVAARTTSRFDDRASAELLRWMRAADSTALDAPGFSAARLPHWFGPSDPWPSTSPARLAFIERLTDELFPLGDSRSGARVGIGVATGADRVFITQDPDLVEDARLLPLSMVRDTTTGRLTWSGSYLVNPWDDSGELVDLDRFPRLKSYLSRWRATLAARHVGRRQPARWYRTIDKVDASLTNKPKLLFPDMKLTSEPVLDPGGHYPHHNLYYVSSPEWDLRVLGGLLLSKIAEAFIDAYAVKMRGGTLRFQAQYLRRIPIPRPDSIPARRQRELIDAFDRRDATAATVAAQRVYGVELPY
jgi:hypothetical protein